MTLEKSYATAGTYAVVVSADWTGNTIDQAMSGHATRTDTVQVLTACVAPQIVTQPSDQLALAGATAQFSVSATSPFPMTYVWYFNQTNQIFSAADFAILTLPNLTAASAGLYSVVVTNAFGSATSSVARLTVATPFVAGAARNVDGSVTLHFVGLPNSAARLWAATNLTPPVLWLPVFTNNNVGPDGTWQFTDTNAVGFPVRFYRFSTP
jgi:hypothetical protein